MKKYAAIVCVVLICLSVLSGCMKQPLPDLPSDAIAFEMGTFIDSEHDDDSFGTIEYNGRTYIAYGTISNAYNQGCVESCIGYIVQDENSSSVVDLDNRNWRIYTLTEDPDHNFLMDFDDSTTLMNQPGFFRAMDTNGEDIEIPDCIESLGYEYWAER